METAAELMLRLKQEAEKMSTSVHRTYLCEVLNTLAGPNPSADAGQHALRLLSAMWGTAYASSANTKAALNDVGTWLERRLREGVSTELLLKEVGWLKRLVKFGERTTNRSQQQRDAIIKKTFGEPARQPGGSANRPFERKHTAVAPPPRPLPPPRPAQENPTVPVKGQGQGLLTRTKGDGTLRVTLQDGKVAIARQKLAAELYCKLSDEVRAKLDRGRDVRVSVSWVQVGNAREISSIG